MTELEQIDVRGVPVWVRKAVQWDRNIAYEVLTYPLPSLADAPLVIDLGAHIGSFVARIHNINPAAPICAVEVDRDNFEVLQRNAPYARTFLRRVGYDVREAFVYHASAENLGGHCVVFNPEAFPAEQLSAAPPSITLEALLEGYERNDAILKIDIEGGEFDVLMNAPLDTLQRFQWIVGERHDMPDVFWKTIGQRLAADFDIRDIHHPVSTLEVLGTFVCKRKA